MVKRQYMQALPFYIAERESKMAELEKQNQLKKNLAKTIEDEGNQIMPSNTSQAAALAKMEGRAPPAHLERSLDPIALDRAAKSRDEFKAIYDQVREMKR